MAACTACFHPKMKCGYAVAPSSSPCPQAPATLRLFIRMYTAPILVPGESIAGYSLTAAAGSPGSSDFEPELTFTTQRGNLIRVTTADALFIPCNNGEPTAEVEIKTPETAGRDRELYSNPNTHGHYCFQDGPPCLMTGAAFHAASRQAFQREQERRSLSGEPLLANNRFTGSTFAHIAVDAAEATSGPWVGWSTENIATPEPNEDSNESPSSADGELVYDVAEHPFECLDTDEDVLTAPLLRNDIGDTVSVMSNADFFEGAVDSASNVRSFYEEDGLLAHAAAKGA